MVQVSAQRMSFFEIFKVNRTFPAILFVAATFSIAQHSTANAQSAACLQLQNQLSSLSVGGSSRSSPRYRQYNRAVNDQRAQISKTKRMARRNGCNNKFFGKKSSTCGRILASLDQMSANLSGLERERRRLAPRGSGSSDNRRRSIIRNMNQRGCFSGNQRQANARPRNRSLVEQIFGVRTFSNDGTRGLFERPNARFSSRYNTYRTMCVRKKDGYYFPVSFSTTPDRFEYDERICQSKCPNTDVALYFHAMPAQDSEDMVSFRGQLPYAELPTAFAYRKKFDPEASCRYTTGLFQEIAGGSGERENEINQQDSSLTRIGKPKFRVSRSIDPETASNNLGNFNTDTIDKLLNKPDELLISSTVTTQDKNIRVVGPAFFPVQ